MVEDGQGLKDDSLCFHSTFQKEDPARIEEVDLTAGVNDMFIEVLKNGEKF